LAELHACEAVRTAGGGDKQMTQQWLASMLHDFVDSRIGGYVLRSRNKATRTSKWEVLKYRLEKVQAAGG
jgi:hypothetical protein